MNIEINSRNFVIAVLVGVGLLFEALKYAAAPSGHVVDEGPLAIKPYAVSEKVIQAAEHVVSEIGAGVIKAVHAVPPMDFKSFLEKWQKDQTKVIQDQKKKEKAAKNWHWSWNAKLQRWEWRKKVAKKPAAETATTDTQIAATPTSSSNANTGSAPSVPAPIPLGVVTGQIPAPTIPGAGVGGGATDHFLSAQEWENLLLNSANQSETDYFVQQHKSHLVTDQVFYQVIGMMLKSSNSGVQAQGIRALGESPAAESFVLLATEQQTLQTSSTLNTSITTYLNTYAQSANLTYLKQVMTTTQTATVLIASETVLQQALQGGTNTTTGPSAQAGAAALTGFLPALQKLESNSNTTVSSDAQNLYNSINSSKVLA